MRRHPSAFPSPIARHGNFNCLLTNGDALFVHCSSDLAVLQRLHPFPRARLVDCDLTMDLGELNHADDRMVIEATEPLTVDEQWERLVPGETRVFVGGAPVWRQRCLTTRRFPAPAWQPGGAMSHWRAGPPRQLSRLRLAHCGMQPDPVNAPA